MQQQTSKAADARPKCKQRISHLCGQPLGDDGLLLTPGGAGCVGGVKGQGHLVAQQAHEGLDAAAPPHPLLWQRQHQLAVVCSGMGDAELGPAHQRMVDT